MSTPEERLAVLEFRLSEVEKKLASVMSGAPTGGGAAVGSSGGGRIATDRDLDSQWGDPIVKKDPKRWQGPSYAGCHMSECSPEYLEEVASLCDWMGDKDDEQGKTWSNPKKPGSAPVPASKFKREEAARARGWAKRLRERGPVQRSAPPPAEGNEFETGGGADYSDNEIPF